MLSSSSVDVTLMLELLPPLRRLCFHPCLGCLAAWEKDRTWAKKQPIQLRCRSGQKGLIQDVIITSLHCLNCRVVEHFRIYSMILLMTSDFLIPCGPCCNLRSTAKALITIPHSRLKHQRGPCLFC